MGHTDKILSGCWSQANCNGAKLEHALLFIYQEVQRVAWFRIKQSLFRQITARIMIRDFYYTSSRVGPRLYIKNTQFSTRFDDRIARFIFRMVYPSK